MQIRQSYLKAAAFFTSQDPTRYSLRGVLVTVEKGYVYYVATDGHKLLALRHELAEGDEGATTTIIIPTKILKTLAAAKIRQDEVILEACRDGKYTLAAILFAPIDGTFPDWRRVTPKEISREMAFINPQHTMCFIKAAKVLGVMEPLIRVIPNGNGPAIVNLGEDIDGYGLVMPFKGPDFELPSWAHN